MRKHIQYMQLCNQAASIFSTCGKRQYAAIVVDEYGHVVGMGYNGGPKGSIHCIDGGCPRYLEDSPSGSVYDNCIAIHAEANALLHTDYSSRPKRIYVNGPPCFSCAKLIANSTLEEVYFMADDSYMDWHKVKQFLINSNVNVVEINNASI
jgi:dCMP deaminase